MISKAKLKQKSIQKVLSKKLSLKSQFLKSPHSLETWDYLRKSGQLVDREKIKNFRFRRYNEQPTRVLRNTYNYYKNQIKADGINGLFYTYFMLEEDPNFRYDYVDCYFLSKKYKNRVYSVYIRTPFLNMFDELDNITHDMLINKGMYVYKNVLSGLKDIPTKSNEEIEKETLSCKANQSIFKKENYRYTVGLSITVNNGKYGLTLDEIAHAINLFLENGEEDLTITMANEPAIDYLDQIIYANAGQSLRLYTLIKVRDEAIQAFLEKAVKENLITQEEVDLYVNQNYVSKNYQEEIANEEKRKAINKKVGNLKLIENGYEITEDTIYAEIKLAEILTLMEIHKNKLADSLSTKADYDKTGKIACVINEVLDKIKQIFAEKYDFVKSKHYLKEELEKEYQTYFELFEKTNQFSETCYKHRF